MIFLLVKRYVNSTDITLFIESVQFCSLCTIGIKYELYLYFIKHFSYYFLFCCINYCKIHQLHVKITTYNYNLQNYNQK